MTYAYTLSVLVGFLGLAAIFLGYRPHPDAKPGSVADLRAQQQERRQR